MKKSIIILAVLSFFSFNSGFSQSKTAYRIDKVFHIESGGGYDYLTVDSASDNLYISHGSQVNILNKLTGDSIGVIEGEKDVHGIAIVHDLGKGYITNGSLNSVIVFDLKTNKVLSHVPTGKFADGIFYDVFSKKVISCNGMSKNMTVIDPSTDSVAATIQLTGWPETATSDGTGKIYVNNSEKSEIDVIDANTFKIVDRWPVAPGTGPSGLAIDKNTMRLFIGCGNKLLIVMNAENGKIITRLPIGDGCDAVGFDGELKTVYSSNGEGTLTIINELPGDKFVVKENLKTEKGARTLTVDQSTRKLYLPTAKFQPATPKTFRPSTIPGTFKILVVDIF
ncbi:YncE family protein [Ferruginibacter paludis]|uniref:YncE family protein n=1 Tax=Ferruginibacter paludis TaxID=1310417 RepID=UPI0025B3B5D4|nr:YncE family protein [Ferruginibacter paludis]MDN3656752.1 YncE family protein [Ferruginibacter paludis]